MKRILLRAKKDPFEVLSAEDSLERNIIGTNSGNLIFIGAAYKLLATRDTLVEPHRRVPNPMDADRINERYDAYVVPLADAFRTDFEPSLIRLTRLIERLRIPVTVLGVGARSDLQYDSELLKPIERTVRQFVAAVLDRSPSIGVRGEFSQSYLKSLGFRDVEIVGCPSMFMYGPKLHVEKASPALPAEARLAINMSSGVPIMDNIVRSHIARYPNMIHIAQDESTLRLLLWRETAPEASSFESDLVSNSQPFLRDNRVRFFVDPWPWIEHLRGYDFAFGTRIHGNIAALLAGTPACVIAHDSRTLELVRFFKIPHRMADDPDAANIDAARLYDEADFSDLNKGHASRWTTFADFLSRHRLAHIFSEGEDAAAFDARVRATPFPAAIDACTARRSNQAQMHMRRLRYRLRRAAGTWLRARRSRAS